MYADKITNSMDRAIKETKRRRAIQMKYNEEHNIVPKTIIKDIRSVIEATKTLEEEEIKDISKETKKLTQKEKNKLIKKYKEEMLDAAKNLQFERAAELRDIISDLEKN